MAANYVTIYHYCRGRYGGGGWGQNPELRPVPTADVARLLAGTNLPPEPDSDEDDEDAAAPTHRTLASSGRTAPDANGEWFEFRAFKGRRGKMRGELSRAAFKKAVAYYATALAQTYVVKMGAGGAPVGIRGRGEVFWRREWDTY